MPVPAGVLADLVVVQACFSFAGLKGLLDGPPCTGGPGQVGEGYSFGSVGQVVGDVGRVGEAASGEEPVLGLRIARAVDACPGPGVTTITL